MASDDNSMQVQSWVDKYSKQYGVDPNFSNAVMNKESGGDVNAVSKKGAVGTFQVMPATFKEMLPDGDINNPEDVVKAGIKYLSILHKQTGGNYADTLGAYNAGSTGYKQMKKKGVYAPETLGYINDPRFNPWVGDQTIANIANPMKSKSDVNKFTPEQLQKGALKNATSEAEASSTAASMQPTPDVTAPDSVLQTQRDYQNALNQQKLEADAAEAAKKRKAYQQMGYMALGAILGVHKKSVSGSYTGYKPGGEVQSRTQGFGDKNLANFQIANNRGS